jgi:hypothetical protein
MKILVSILSLVSDVVVSRPGKGPFGTAAGFYRLKFFGLAVIFFSTVASAGPLLIKDKVGTPADFPIVINGRAAEILVDKTDAEVVRVAANMLAGDIQRVSGVKPGIGGISPANRDTPVIIIGTIGRSAMIADLVQRGKLDVQNIEGKWESFIIQTVANPFPDTPIALVIAGSDRRGAAYGAVTVSEAIGVSPWVWWADVVPRSRANLVLSGTVMQGPPSVKYRGIFINDEDNGIQPWAAKTFEPEVNNIGPKTYAKICELLLRLKANYLWPAMHACSKSFNSFPENKAVADRHAIVMGSSHCEQMLRNNIAEWPENQRDDWNPVTNLPAIMDYWEQRVRENGKYENVYTIGMRGIHDDAMPGGGAIAEKRARLEKIINLQRGLLARHVHPDAAQAPQIFCPYKEVLDIYQDGMTLPGDITIVWPDDNYGYIRQLSNAEERKRSGGSGIYYHLSYLGNPHDYLWLDSTSPALIWHEMTKAYELGARNLWVVNVGDIKSTETGMTLFLALAWNISSHGPDVQRMFLRDFYTQQFGEDHAGRIATLRDEYYRLCAIRKPEHLGFNLRRTPVQNSGWPPEETQRILERWQALARDAEALADKLPADLRDAYFQLVEYPACAGAAMAEKLLLAEKARLTGSTEAGRRAAAAFMRIQKLTTYYNAHNGGKWRGMMDWNPRGGLPVFKMPPTADGQTEGATPAAAAIQSAGGIVIDITKPVQLHDRHGAGWRVIEGLGPRGAAIAVIPHQDTPTLRTPGKIRASAPYVGYTVQAGAVRGSEVEIAIEALPTHPFTPAHEVLAAISINDEDPVLVHFDQGKDDENDPAWQKNVLRGFMTGSVKLKMPAGGSTLKVWAADPGVVVQRIVIKPQER